MRAGLILPAARASCWRSRMTLDFGFLSVSSPTRPACCSIPRYQGCSRCLIACQWGGRIGHFRESRAIGFEEVVLC